MKQESVVVQCLSLCLLDTKSFNMAFRAEVPNLSVKYIALLFFPFIFRCFSCCLLFLLFVACRQIAVLSVFMQLSLHSSSVTWILIQHIFYFIWNYWYAHNVSSACTMEYKTGCATPVPTQWHKSFLWGWLSVFLWNYLSKLVIWELRLPNLIRFPTLNFHSRSTISNQTSSSSSFFFFFSVVLWLM